MPAGEKTTPMNSHTMDHSAAAAVSSPSAVNLIDKLALQVQGLIDDAQVSDDDRRNRDRFPIPYTFRLTPIDRDGNLVTDETTTVVGKDLSLTGIGFSHDHPLLCRRVIISLDHPKVGRFAVEAEVVWTRPTPIGLYESGCRLIRTVDGHILRMKG